MQTQIEKIYDKLLTSQKSEELSQSENQCITQVIHDLNYGLLRVCEKNSQSNSHSEWITHEWIKKAILLYFRIQKMTLIKSEDFHFYDKIPVKKWDGSEGVRVVPQAIARWGSFINKGVILMPSYVNIGAYVDTGTMVDTWATVGSCAQVGTNVHLSGGVGIGGVLEPISAHPVIIENNCFIGSRCIVVEGALIETGAVLGAGVTITSSTKIIDVSESITREYKAYVPQNSVVIPGSITKKFPAGEYQVPCALIIGKRKPSTDTKTSLTEALRDFQVSV